jgi:hypothetical protein
MLISNRVKTLAAAAFTASFIALGSASPVAAQPGYAPGVTHAGRHHDSTALQNRGREAFGMAVPGGGFVDQNSPEATGGGSLGYNRKLLEY